MSNLQLTKDFRQGSKNESVFSTVEEDKFQMTIDPNSMTHIMARLTDLYSDPIVATVREIMSNAVDSTRLVPLEKRKPIKIAIPRTLSRELVITDFGLGLSMDEIKDIYTRYGSSTKRSDMTQIGAYGLGSKAPLSYTSQFSVKSVKDGELSQILISTEDGINEVKIIEHEESVNEDNMVSVSIPVKERDINAFSDALETYVLHEIDGVEISGLDSLKENISESGVPLDLGTIDYNGVPLKLSVSFTTRNIASFLINQLLEDNVSVRLYGIMSGFTYNLAGSGYDIQTSVYVDLTPGLVDFSSSRDEITNTSRKQALVDFLQDKIGDILKTRIIDVILTHFPEDNFKRALLSNLIGHSSEFMKRIFDNKELSKKLFTLENGTDISQSKVRPIAVIRGDRYILSYHNYEYGTYGYSNLSTSARITKALNVMLDIPAEIARRESDNEAFSEDSYRREATDSKTIEMTNTVSLTGLHSRDADSILIITDISDSKKSEKIIRGRKLLIGDSASHLLVLAKESKSDIKSYMDNAFVGTERVEYLTEDEGANRLNKLRKAQREASASKTKKTATNAYVIPFKSLSINTPFDFIKELKNRSIDNYSLHGNQMRNRYQEENTLPTIGLIISQNNNNAEDSLDRAIPYLLKMTEGTSFKLNIYCADSLLLRNYDSLIENDYLLNIARSGVFRSTTLEKLVNEQNLPMVDKVDISTINDDTLESLFDTLHYLFTEEETEYSRRRSFRTIEKELSVRTDLVESRHLFLNNVALDLTLSTDIVNAEYTETDKKFIALAEEYANSKDFYNAEAFLANKFINSI